MKSHFAVLPYRALPILLILPAVLLAQAPIITAVLNQASGDAGLSPGVLADVYYTPIAESDQRHGNPYSMVFVQVGGHPALVMGVRAAVTTPGGVASVLLPRESVPGAAATVITNTRGSSAPFGIVLAKYSPALAYIWSGCEEETQVAHLGAVGLGPIDPPASTFEGWSPGREYTTVTTPEISVAGIMAHVQNSAAYPWLGAYGVTFKVPPGAPEGIQPVVLSIGGIKSNSVDLLVGMENRSSGGAYDKSLPELIRAAPESLVTAKGCSVPFARGEYVGDAANPPAILGGTSVLITDSAGVGRPAALHSVSPYQVKYIVPRGTANGRATVTISTAGGAVSTSPLDIAAIEPAVFCGTNWLCGWTPIPTAYVVRVRDGVQTVEALRDVPPEEEEGGEAPFRFVDLEPETDQVYLVIFGTGWRNRSSLANVSVKFGDLEAPVEYAGPQGEFAGMDQVNVRLSKSFAGQPRPRLPVDGKAANAAWLVLR